MSKTRQRNKSELERLAEQVLVTSGKSYEQIQKIFEDHYNSCGATDRRTMTRGTYDMQRSSKWNRSADPKVKEYLEERIEDSEKPLSESERARLRAKDEDEND
jgi:transposase